LQLLQVLDHWRTTYAIQVHLSKKEDQHGMVETGH
jgi:hypothetical protein